MSDDREAWKPLQLPEGRDRLPGILNAERDQLKERVAGLEGDLKRLLELWTAQTSTVRVEPGGALLVGGVGRLPEDVDAVERSVALLREATGMSKVWFFEGAIDVRTVALAELGREVRAQVCREEGHNEIESTPLGSVERHLRCVRCGEPRTTPFEEPQ